MNTHLPQSELLPCTIWDNKWTWEPVDLSKIDYPKKYQIYENDYYVVNYKPRSGLKHLLGRLFGVNDCPTVFDGAGLDRRWIKLYSRFKRFLYEPELTLVKKHRLDSWDLFCYRWDSGYIVGTLFNVQIEGRVNDPIAFVRFLSYPGNQKRIMTVINIEIKKYIDSLVQCKKDVHGILEDNRIWHNLLDEAGYKVEKITLFFKRDKLSCEQNHSSDR